MKCQKFEVNFVSYDGKYPCLCFGTLVLSLNGKNITFPSSCLSSGGSTYFTNDYAESHVERGSWSISDWPEGWPECAKRQAEDVVNSFVSEGCCGGCL